eukprot:COSAG05_NODE_507_length_9159_cov_53.489183_5_plen_59_part_00
MGGYGYYIESWENIAAFANKQLQKTALKQRLCFATLTTATPLHMCLTVPTALPNLVPI